MKKAITTWMWCLKVVFRSYRTVVVLAALVALWVFAAYEWLGLPESSGLLLILGFVWALVQLLATVVILGGIVFTAAETSGAGGSTFPLQSLCRANGKRLLNAIGFCGVSLFLVWICGALFGWINGHSIELASYLTYHLQRPVSHVLVEHIFDVIEGLLWVVFAGFLLSFFINTSTHGWLDAAKQTGGLLAAAALRAPFLTTLLSAVVFGELSFKLAHWRPLVAPGFLDYTQMVARFSVVLILTSAGALFWPLALARLILPPAEKPHEGAA
jgi:hypothetical protein